MGTFLCTIIVKSQITDLILYKKKNLSVPVRKNSILYYIIYPFLIKREPDICLKKVDNEGTEVEKLEGGLLER